MQAADGLAGGYAAAAGTSGDADSADDSSADSDLDAEGPGPAPDYDGTEAAYVYDDYYGEYLLATAKGVTGDKDVFGDRSVVILAMPGHTPATTHCSSGSRAWGP